jgi:hypothetical protein
MLGIVPDWHLPGFFGIMGVEVKKQSLAGIGGIAIDFNSFNDSAGI